MGCICSKAIARSISIREDLSNSFQSASVAWEELLASSRGNDQPFAFLYSTNTSNRTNELRASSFVLPSNDLETNLEAKYFVNALDLISDMERKTEMKLASGFDGEPDFGRFTRSKSYQMPREEMSGLSSETERPDGKKLEWKDKNLRGSKSFHTVEEYDALLERILKSSARSRESFEDYHSPAGKKSESHLLKSFDEDRSKAQNGSNIFAQEFAMEKDCIEGGLDLDSESFQSVRNLINLESVEREPGWKRKAAAKGLKSLDVPTIEFPASTRLRQRIHAVGQVYSPGTYVTPKFGSYNDKKTNTTIKEEGRESSTLSPELLAAFEDCIHQLQVEENSILHHMNGCKHTKNGNGE